MDHLDYPCVNTWTERKTWIESLISKYQNKDAGYLVGEQSCALLIDLQAAYCCGIWTAVVLLSQCIVEDTLKSTESLDSRSNAKKLMDDFGSHPELHWLRKLRNSLVHSNLDNPTITVDDQYGNRVLWQSHARKAAEIAIATVFQSPIT